MRAHARTRARICARICARILSQAAPHRIICYHRAVTASFSLCAPRTSHTNPPTHPPARRPDYLRKYAETHTDLAPVVETPGLSLDGKPEDDGAIPEANSEYYEVVFQDGPLGMGVEPDEFEFGKINMVPDGGQAAKGGVKQGDVIAAVDQVPMG